MHLVRARKAMERELGEERFVFDAFVSYTHRDKDWVVHQLLRKLEYDAKIRLCLHQRYDEGKNRSLYQVGKFQKKEFLATLFNCRICSKTLELHNTFVTLCQIEHEINYRIPCLANDSEAINCNENICFHQK